MFSISCAASPRAPELEVVETSAAPHTQPGPGDIEFPAEAFALLYQSTRDSCSVCAQDNRAKAFELLDEAYPPGTLLATSPHSQLVRVPNGENELALTSFPLEGPAVTFRFHTDSNHLVGIAEVDRTDEELGQFYLATRSGQRFDGLLEIVRYAYGDGQTYLYFPARNHLQIQCRILDLGVP